MFLKGFKEKSNKKIINALLKSRQVFVTNTKIEHLGVLLHINEFHDFEAFRKLANTMNILPNKLKIVAFTSNEKETPNFWEVCFSAKDFGWKGTVNNIELQTFIDTKFDALISYYSEELTELELITAKSNAQFKIGILQTDERLNDLIIKTKINDFTTFQNEVLKYLNIFNKLKHAK
ncbi:MAG TPA: hypothetical protein VFF15_05075 [Flavobacteriaceae bacterium]|nr:hypothetical protein [Flavobacteriaceae bacterium]